MSKWNDQMIKMMNDFSPWAETWRINCQKNQCKWAEAGRTWEKSMQMRMRLALRWNWDWKWDDTETGTSGLAYSSSTQRSCNSIHWMINACQLLKNQARRAFVMMTWTEAGENMEIVATAAAEKVVAATSAGAAAEIEIQQQELIRVINYWEALRLETAI